MDELLGDLREKAPDVTTQLFDLERVPGSRYLLLATYNAIKSFGSKQPIARTLSMEILLYVAATRQIQDAVVRVGVTDTTRRAAAVIVGNSEDGVLKAAEVLRGLLGTVSVDELIDKWDSTRIESIRSNFRIGDKELSATVRKNETLSSAIQRLAVERSAILSIKK